MGPQDLEAAEALELHHLVGHRVLGSYCYCDYYYY